VWLTATGHVAEAARLFDRATQIAPDDLDARRLLAQSLDSLGQPAQAEAVRRRP
jgi:Flp pilus assembly protein TadD